APRDRVSHNPVQSNGCEQRRQESEDRGESGNHTLGPERIADLFLGGSHGVNREVRIHLANSGSRGAHYRSGIDGRPHVHRHAALAREACSQKGNKRLFRNGISQTPVYFVSFTTPIISMFVFVPGSVPKPRWRPMGFLPAKYRRAKVSLMMTAVVDFSSSCNRLVALAVS